LQKSDMDLCNMHPEREEELFVDAELMCHIIILPRPHMVEELYV